MARAAISIVFIVLLFFPVSFLFLFAGRASAGGDDCGEKPGEEPAARDAFLVAQDANEFAASLYKRLAEPRKGRRGNVFFSPFSIETALAMTWTGARGETGKQMAEVLHLRFPPGREAAAFGRLREGLLHGTKGTPGGCLLLAGALWGQKGFGFLDDFLRTLRGPFEAEFYEVDFEGAAETARGAINDWVSRKTEKKIEELISPGLLGSLTRLVLTDAVYFKGEWAAAFSGEKTRRRSFHVACDHEVSVPFMERKGSYPYARGEGFEAVALPYTGGDLSMVILLPAGEKDLSSLEKSLSGSWIADLAGRMKQRELSLSLPKFRLAFSCDAARTLAAMGMPAPFTGAADFSGMTGRKELFISNVVHKAFVEVNEEGTEAAAATGVVMRLAAAAPPLVFRADRPFVFLIRDGKSGAVLFMGRLADPSKKGEA